MTTAEPHIDERPAVPFVGTTTGVTTSTFAEIADRLPTLRRPGRRSSAIWTSAGTR
jgi:hypothetical protein